MAPKEDSERGAVVDSQEAAGGQGGATTATTTTSTPARIKKVRKVSRRARSLSRPRRPKKYSVNSEGTLKKDEIIAAAAAQVDNVAATTKEQQEAATATAEAVTPPASPRRRREMTSSAMRLSKLEAEFDSPRRICVRELLSGNSPSPTKSQYLRGFKKTDSTLSNGKTSNKSSLIKASMMPDLNDFTPPPIDDFDDCFSNDGRSSNPTPPPPPPPIVSPASTVGSNTKIGTASPSILRPSKRDHNSSTSSTRRSRSVARSTRIEEEEEPATAATVEAKTSGRRNHRNSSKVQETNKTRRDSSSKRRSRSVARSTRLDKEVPEASSSSNNHKRNSLLSLGIDSPSSRDSSNNKCRDRSVSSGSTSSGGSGSHRRTAHSRDKSKRRSRSVARSTRLDEEVALSESSSPSGLLKKGSVQHKKPVSLRALGIEASHGNKNNKSSQYDRSVSSGNGGSTGSPRLRIRQKVSPEALADLNLPPGSPSGRYAVRKKAVVAPPGSPDRTAGGPPKDVTPRLPRKLPSPVPSPARVVETTGMTTPNTRTSMPRKKMGAYSPSPGRRSIRVKQSVDNPGDFVIPSDLLLAGNNNNNNNSPERVERRRLSACGGAADGKNVVRVAVRVRRSNQRPTVQ